jgi:hypothetical protein
MHRINNFFKNDVNEKRLLIIYFIGLIIVSVVIIYINWDKTTAAELGIVPIIQDFPFTVKFTNETTTTPAPNETTQSSPIVTLTQPTGEEMRNITVRNNSVIMSSSSNVTQVESKIRERESTLLYISALFGILGASAHSIASLTTWIGNNKYSNRWLAWYIARPPIGAAIAVIVYMLLRAGLIPSSSFQVSAFGIAALSALAGFLTNETTQKLRDIFDSLFGIKKSDEQKGDVPLRKDFSIKLSSPKTVIKVGDDLELKAVAIKADGSYGSNIDLSFTATPSTILKFEDKYIGKTDSEGQLKVKVKGIKTGNTTVTVTADLDKEIIDELHIKVEDNGKTSPPVGPTPTPPPV